MATPAKPISLKTLTRKLGRFIGVKNTASRNGMSVAPNQFEILYENGKIFQSYDSIVAAKMNGQLYLGKDHDYSNTTSRHVTQWCGYNTKERREGLENGRFIKIV